MKFADKIMDDLISLYKTQLVSPEPIPYVLGDDEIVKTYERLAAEDNFESKRYAEHLKQYFIKLKKLRIAKAIQFYCEHQDIHADLTDEEKKLIEEIAPKIKEYFGRVEAMFPAAASSSAGVIKFRAKETTEIDCGVIVMRLDEGKEYELPESFRETLEKLAQAGVIEFL